MTKLEQAAEAIRLHPDKSDREIARLLGMSRMTVGRARNTKDAQRDVPPATPALADGFYQVQDGKPYRIACKPGDVFHVDAHGVLQPGPLPTRPKRTVQHRAES